MFGATYVTTLKMAPKQLLKILLTFLVFISRTISILFILLIDKAKETLLLSNSRNYIQYTNFCILKMFLFEFKLFVMDIC